MTTHEYKWVHDCLVNKATGRLKTVQEGLQQSYSPPDPALLSTVHCGKPVADTYFCRRLFVWLPRRLLNHNVQCTTCKSDLTSKGLYTTVREVVDICERYLLATEYLECPNTKCSSTNYIGWSRAIVEQLDVPIQKQFPAILTKKAALDLKVLAFLKQRSLGNSTSLLRNSLEELHSEKYLNTVLLYLSACKRYQRGIQKFFHGPTADDTADTFDPPPPYQPAKTALWLGSCYVRDVATRLDLIKAQITSTFGRVLKLDSTKK